MTQGMQRTELLQIRFTPEEKDRLRRRAQEAGLSMAAYIRSVSAGVTPVQITVISGDALREGATADDAKQ